MERAWGEPSSPVPTVGTGNAPAQSLAGSLGSAQPGTWPFTGLFSTGMDAKGSISFPSNKEYSILRGRGREIQQISAAMGAAAFAHVCYIGVQGVPSPLIPHCHGHPGSWLLKAREK